MVITVTRKEQTRKVMMFDLAACLRLSVHLYVQRATIQQCVPWIIMMVAVAYYSLVNLPNRAAIGEDFYRRVMNELNKTLPVQAVGPCVRKEGRKEPSVAGALVLTSGDLGFYPFLGREQIADTSVFTVCLDKVKQVRGEKKNTLTLCLEDGTEVVYTVNKQKVWAEEIDRLREKS